MTTRTDQSEARSRNLKAAIKRAYRGEQLDDATVAWLRNFPANAVIWARYEIAKDMWSRLIKLTTEKSLYDGDVSALTKFSLYDDVVSYDFTFDMADEIGREAASDYFEVLAGHALSSS